MTNQEFQERLIRELQERLPNAVIFPQEEKKNNGVAESCIIIKDSRSNIAPCISTERLYHEYERGRKDMGGVVDSVLETYAQSRPESDFDTSKFLDYSKARNNLNGKLINTEKNMEALRELPHRDFFDLSLIYFVDVTQDGNPGFASIQVTDSQMERWGVTEDDLYAQFQKNLAQNDRSRIYSLEKILAEELGCQEGTDDICIPMMPMYVLTNSRKLNGAVEILNDKALEKAAETVGNDFYILPSSIHETILVPVEGKEDGADGLAEMVSAVNQTEVLDTEVLSDHVYRYCRQSGQVELAA